MRSWVTLVAFAGSRGLGGVRRRGSLAILGVLFVDGAFVPFGIMVRFVDGVFVFVIMALFVDGAFVFVIAALFVEGVFVLFAGIAIGLIRLVGLMGELVVFARVGMAGTFVFLSGL